MMTGAIIGLVQDALTHQAIGLYGIAKTVVGYGASSLGVKIDVENPGTRLLVTSGFYLVHQAAYFLVARNILGVTAGVALGANPAGGVAERRGGDGVVCGAGSFQARHLNRLVICDLATGN